MPLNSAFYRMEAAQSWRPLRLIHSHRHTHCKARPTRLKLHNESSCGSIPKRRAALRREGCLFVFFIFLKRSVDSNSSPMLNKCDRLSYLSNLQMVIFNFANNSAGFVTKNLYQSCTLNNLHLCILFISLGVFFCLHEPLQYKEY